MAEMLTSETEDFPGPHDDPAASPAPWLSRLARFWPLALGLLAFELTANPMLGVVAACLKFGWDDFLTASWLIRTDPRHARGWACGGFLAAWGCAKTCVVAGIAVLVAIITITCLEGRGATDWLKYQLAGTFFTVLGGGAAFVIVTTMAVLAAWFGRIRVWIGPEARCAHQSGTWPPWPDAALGKPENIATAILRGLAILASFALFVGLLILTVALHLLPDSIAIVPLLIVLLIASFAIVAGVLHSLAGRILATRPDDCWPA